MGEARIGIRKLTSPKNQALLRRRADSSPEEAAFWKGVVSKLGAAGPNWGLDLNPTRAPLSVDTFIYLIDTSSLWHASAAVASERLSELLEARGVGQGGGSPERADAARGIALASAQSELSKPTDALMLAFAAGIAAVARSPAYAASHAHVSPLVANHHWLLLLYRLADGEAIAGLGHIDEPNPGMLDRGVLLESVEALVRMDLGSERTIVNQAVRRAGGVALAPELAHLVRS